MADFGGLRRLAAVAGENFVAGAVLYTGARSLSFGGGLFALPISAGPESAIAKLIGAI